jgi:hypothetical protein
MLPDTEMAEGSKLRKALVCKYDEPTQGGSLRMKWTINSTELIADCSGSQNCKITVEDRNFESRVEDAQREVDVQKKRGAEPDPQL